MLRLGHYRMVTYWKTDVRGGGGGVVKKNYWIKSARAWATCSG